MPLQVKKIKEQNLPEIATSGMGAGREGQKGTTFYLLIVMCIKWVLIPYLKCLTVV